MHISQSDAVSIAIFFVTLIKSVFDILVNPKWYRSQKTSLSIVEAIEKKRKRDSVAAIITFGFVSLLTVQIIGGAAMTQEVSRNDFDLLEQRVKVLEDKLDPTGGGPNAIYKELKKLRGLVYDIASKYVPKNEFERLADAVAKLETKIDELDKPMEVGIGM